MGVYIKGVDMPKDCKECFMRLQCDGHHFEMEKDTDGFWMPKGVKVDCLFIEAEEPKRGEWIPCTKSGLALTELMRREGQKWYGYRCSNCDHIYKGNALTDCNFCPNCGADMRERKESE